MVDVYNTGAVKLVTGTEQEVVDHLSSNNVGPHNIRSMSYDSSDNLSVLYYGGA